MSEQVEKLEADVIRLMGDVDRYRTASEDALQQFDWCIGYFVGTGQNDLAQSLGSNRASIRRQLMGRPAQAVPTGQGD